MEMSELKELFKERIVDKEKVREYAIRHGRKEVVFMKKGVVVAFSLVCLFIIGYVIYSNVNTNRPINNGNNVITDEGQLVKQPAYVTIDINPSVELAVDDNNTVTDVVTLNNDADVAYSDLNLVGQNVDDATKSIVDSAIDLGYIDEVSDTNTVDVTTYSDDDTRRQELNNRIVNNLNAHFVARQIYALVIQNGLDDQLKNEANIYDIPYGKMLLINRAIQLDNTLAAGDLVNLSIKDIQSKIKAVAVARREAYQTQLQTAKQDFKSLKLQKKEQAQTKLQQEKNALVQQSGNSGNLTNEQKQNIINQKKDQIKQQVQSQQNSLQQNNSTVKQQIKNQIQNKLNANK